MALVCVPAAACHAASSDDDGPFEVTVADCGGSLDELYAIGGRTQPSYETSYSEALDAWTFPGEGCGLGLLSGQCADGKRLLYRNGGYGSEIRYYDGERLVGYVGSGDVGICPSVCPFSRFYGGLDSVRCDAPSFDDLCEGASSVLRDGQPWMPFADGQAPGGCER